MILTHESDLLRVKISRRAIRLRQTSFRS